MLAQLTHACILANPNNVPGPIRGAPRSGSHSVNLKNVHRPIRASLRSLVTRCPTGRMFPDLSWLYLSSQPHSVNLKNVHGPIRSSLHLWFTRCRPEECSWTYPGLPQLSAVFCEPEKCSWTYPEYAPLVGHTLLAGR